MAARLTHPLSLSDPELALVEVPKKKPPQPQIVNAAEKADPQIKARVQARKALLQQQQAKLTTSTPLPAPVSAPAPAVLSLLGGSDDEDSSDAEKEEEKNQMDSDDYVWDDNHAKEHLDSSEDSSAAAEAEPAPAPQEQEEEEEPSVLVPLTAQQFENLSQSLSGRIPPKTRQRMPTLLSPPPPPSPLVPMAAAATSSNNIHDSSDSSLNMDLEEGQITPDRETLASRFTNINVPVPTVCDTVEKEQAIDGAFYIVGDHLPRMFVGVGGPPSGQQMLPASAHHGQSITPQLLARAKNHADLSKAAHTLLQLAEPAQAYIDKCYAAAASSSSSSV